MEKFPFCINTEGGKGNKNESYNNNSNRNMTNFTI